MSCRDDSAEPWRLTDRLLDCAADAATRGRIFDVLRPLFGSRVYVSRPVRPRPQDEAARLLREHVTRSDAVSILVARHGFTHRHGRRIVAAALDIRCRSMSASDETVPTSGKGGRHDDEASNDRSSGAQAA